MMTMKKSAGLVLLVVGCWLLVVGLAVAQYECPRPSLMTAPQVRLWQYVEHGPTYARLTVHFRLADGFSSSMDSPLYFGRAADGVWYTTADPEQQETVCVDQYWQLIDYSLGVLNDGQRPFVWDNQDSLDGYELFLLRHHEWLVYLPVVWLE